MYFSAWLLATSIYYTCDCHCCFTNQFPVLKCIHSFINLLACNCMVRQLTINVFPLGRAQLCTLHRGGMHSLDYTTTRAYAIRVHARPHNALHSPSIYRGDERAPVPSIYIYIWYVRVRIPHVLSIQFSVFYASPTCKRIGDCARRCSCRLP